MKGHLYQLLDRDGEPYGLVHSDYEYDTEFMEKLWREFYNSPDHELDVDDLDDFVGWFNSKPRPPIIRVYVNEISPIS